MDAAIAVNKTNIEGVVIQPLKIIEDDRGSVMHMLRVDSPLFQQFGEVYFSSIKPGVVKAWKKHKKMTQNLAVPAGTIQLVIYDPRPDSSTNGLVQTVELGLTNYKIIQIPNGLWYGFKCLSTSDALIANCADMPHIANEVERVNDDSPEIPYQWMEQT